MDNKSIKTIEKQSVQAIRRGVRVMEFFAGSLVNSGISRFLDCAVTLI